jgi:hypothetical protein
MQQGNTSWEEEEEDEGGREESVSCDLDLCGVHTASFSW